MLSKTAKADDLEYSYDGLDRLTNISFGAGALQAFAYDGMGNRTKWISYNPMSISAISNVVVRAGKTSNKIAFSIEQIDLRPLCSNF